MRRITKATCEAFATSCEFEFRRNYPPTVNHARETAFAREVLGELVGAENVAEFEPTMGAEDFSYFLQEKPGCYFVIGNGDGTHRSTGHGGGPCMAGGSAKRRGKQQAAAEQQHQQAVAEQQAQAYVAQQKATYNKAFSACMEGKGYTVK